jgi:hypothetical protein
MEMEMLGMGDIWETGGENSKKIWIRINTVCVDIERQNVEVKMREQSSLTL